MFRALALEKTQIRHDLPPRLSRMLCSSLLFIGDFFSVCFQERLCISFSRHSLLDICLFTYVFLVLFRVPFTVIQPYWCYPEDRIFFFMIFSVNTVLTRQLHCIDSHSKFLLKITVSLNCELLILYRKKIVIKILPI